MRKSILPVSYGIAHIIHGTTVFIILTLAPQFSVSIVDPVFNNPAASYDIVCYPNAAIVKNRDGGIECAEIRFGDACWTIIEKVNTGKCGGPEFAAVGSEFYQYGQATDIFVALIVSLLAASMVLVISLYYFPTHNEEISAILLYLHIFMLFMSVGLLISADNAMDQASYTDNNNRGQKAYAGMGLVMLVYLPIGELILDNSPKMWT